MTTQNDDQGIPVDGAPGGRFYVQAPQNPKLSCFHCGQTNDCVELKFLCKNCPVQLCTACMDFGINDMHAFRCKEKPSCLHCGKKPDREEIKFSCKNCLINICSMCVGFGYDTIHEDRCRGGICDKFVRYVCTCTRIPIVGKCEYCLAAKVEKYNCFNCEDPRKATYACEGCLNHFTCSEKCYKEEITRSHSHKLTCNTSIFEPCKHGTPIILKRNCDCEMCVHGMWAETCPTCITNAHYNKLYA
jgi:hypothetical protein